MDNLIMLTFDEVGPTLSLPLDLHRCTSSPHEAAPLAAVPILLLMRWALQSSNIWHSRADRLLCSARIAIQHALPVVPVVLAQAEEHDAQELEDIRLSQPDYYARVTAVLTRARSELSIG
jgi:hypothetical protein